MIRELFGLNSIITKLRSARRRVNDGISRVENQPLKRKCYFRPSK